MARMKHHALAACDTLLRGIPAYRRARGGVWEWWPRRRLWARWYGPYRCPWHVRSDEAAIVVARYEAALNTKLAMRADLLNAARIPFGAKGRQALRVEDWRATGEARQARDTFRRDFAMRVSGLLQSIAKNARSPQ